MQDWHGMKLVERADTGMEALSGGTLNRVSSVGALMRRHPDAITGAAGTEPGTWADARVEDVIATLDAFATMAAREADRLREFQDRRCR